MSLNESFHLIKFEFQLIFFNFNEFFHSIFLRINIAFTTDIYRFLLSYEYFIYEKKLV
jgi:hypothetical protein